MNEANHAKSERRIAGAEGPRKASGISSAYYKIVGFALNGFFAGVAGSVYPQTHMQFGPGMLASSLSVLTVLLATIGGTGTLVALTHSVR